MRAGRSRVETGGQACLYPRDPCRVQSMRAISWSPESRGERRGLAQETTGGAGEPREWLGGGGLVLGMERHNNKIIITVSNKFKCFMALLLTHNKIKMLGTC